jgi:hypothetical protein
MNRTLARFNDVFYMNDGNTKTIFSNGSYSNIIPNLIIKIIKPRDKSYLSVRIDHI